MPTNMKAKRRANTSASSARPFQRCAILFLCICPLAASANVAFAQDASSTAALATREDDSATISGEQVKSVLKQPLNDLNVMQPEIAPVLKRALASLYAPATDCEEIASELKELDSVLGPDLDVHPKLKSFKDKAVNTAFDGARDAALGFIPYRGAVRFVTGAEKHDRDAAKAMLAGEIRRGYLKGVANERGCRTDRAPSGANAS